MNFLYKFYLDYKDQLGRFVRIAVVTFLASGVLTGSTYTKDALVAAVVAALEVAWRVVSPTVPVTSTVPPPA